MAVLRGFPVISKNHSQPFFTKEIWRQNQNMAASDFCHDRKSGLMGPVSDRVLVNRVSKKRALHQVI